MFPRVACLLLMVVLLGGCALFRKKAQPVQDTRPFRLGRVALVNESERFALIETDTAAPPAAGTVLRIYRGDAVAGELRATSVRRKPFLVADLITGAPAKGDVVFQPRGESADPPRAAPSADSPTPPAAPKVPAWRRWLFFFGVRK